MANNLDAPDGAAVLLGVVLGAFLIFLGALIVDSCDQRSYWQACGPCETHGKVCGKLVCDAEREWE